MPYPYRWRRLLRFLGVAALLIAVAALAARPWLQRTIRARLIEAGTRRGLEVDIEAVRLGLWPPLRLRRVSVGKADRVRLEAAEVDVWWRGRPRIEIADAVLRGPAEMTVNAEWTVWDVLASGADHLRVALERPARGLVFDRTVTPGRTTWKVEAEELLTARLLEVRRGDRPILDGGTMHGALQCVEEAGEVRLDLDATARSARLPALAADASEEREEMGAPVQLAVQATGVWNRAAGFLEVPHFGATVAGASASGTLALREIGRDPAIDLSLEIERVDFARLLSASGLPAPEALVEAGAAAPAPASTDPSAGAASGDSGAGGPAVDLGAASLSATARGRLSDPASFVVTQQLRFAPPARMPRAIERLRGDFVHEVSLRSGGRRGLEVSRVSPDFIPLEEVPPLFRRALLIAEDAGFFSHPGVDLREVPAALLTDLARGGAVRGASTITQQLAKNLFLSRDRNVGRKLQELSLALLLESALGKERILEIYLNVIEWGPDLHGLRPAARTYFGREPAQLTAAQTAFLVSLIPAPVKYQVSFKDGTPGPGLRQLMDALLAKLRSVDALTEEEYRLALAEPILVEGRGAAPPDAPAAASDPPAAASDPPAPATEPSAGTPGSPVTGPEPSAAPPNPPAAAPPAAGEGTPGGAAG